MSPIWKGLTQPNNVLMFQSFRIYDCGMGTMNHFALGKPWLKCFKMKLVQALTTSAHSQYLILFSKIKICTSLALRPCSKPLTTHPVIRPLFCGNFKPCWCVEHRQASQACVRRTEGYAPSVRQSTSKVLSCYSFNDHAAMLTSAGRKSHEEHCQETLQPSDLSLHWDLSLLKHSKSINKNGRQKDRAN